MAADPSDAQSSEAVAVEACAGNGMRERMEKNLTSTPAGGIRLYILINRN